MRQHWGTDSAGPSLGPPAETQRSGVHSGSGSGSGSGSTLGLGPLWVWVHSGSGSGSRVHSAPTSDGDSISSGGFMQITPSSLNQ